MSDLTPRENEILATAFHCMNSKPDIDYDKLASLATFKTAKSARDSFNAIFKRLVASATTSTDGAGENTSPAKAIGGRKRKADTDNKTTGKKPRGKRSAKKEESVSGEEDEDAVAQSIESNEDIKEEGEMEDDE